MSEPAVILVVDDEATNARLLDAILRLQNYRVIVAADGAQCLDIVSAERVDVVLLDVMMPGIDGIETLRRLRSDPRHRLIPVILLTALDAVEDRVRGIQAGCDDFISKPFDQNELLARIRGLLSLNYYRLQVDEKKKLEAVIASVSDGIVVCSPDWSVQRCNPAAARYFELEGEREVSLLERIARIYRCTVPLPGLRDIDHAPGEFGLVREETARFRSLHLHVVATVIRDPAGHASGIVVSARDVTELVREQRLKADFISLISHKLRTPLTPIMLELSTMGQCVAGQPQLEQSVNRFSLHVRQLHDLIERLIGFVSASQDSRQPGPASIAVRQRLETIVESYAGREPARGGVRLRSGNVNPRVEMHIAMFDLVIKNLIDNGLKFNDSAQPMVTLSVGMKGNRAQIAVSDNGPGIPPEHQERIFDAFSQPEKDFTGSVPGAGLGLAIVQRVVLEYGGSVEVESRIGKGSIMTVSLPSVAVTRRVTAPVPAAS